MGELETLAREMAGQADFRVVYVREAHPVDGWRMEANDRAGITVKDPKTNVERESVATVCMRELKISIPCVLDNIDNAVEHAYSGWPDRIYIIGSDGKIAYKGRPGPGGFRPQEAAAALRELLSLR